MTILAELTGTVDVIADDSASLLGDVEVTDAGTFWFLLDVDARASVAFAQRYQQLGIGLVVAGVAIPDREVGKVLTITESADSYGDRLSLRLDGPRFSPFARNLIRSGASVVVSMVTGNAGNEFRGVVFSGYIVSAEFEGQPPSATIVCLDESGRFAQTRLKTWTLAANSGRSRLSIGLEWCELAGISVGFVDLGGDGGRINKPLAPGDTPILDVLRDFWGVVGAEIGFEAGKLCARRYNANDPHVLELHAGNLLAEFTLTSPEILSPNVLGVVSTSYAQGSTDAQPPVEQRVSTYSVYARKGITDLSAIYRKVSEVITRTTRRGTLEVLVDEEEWGYYSPLACPSKIQTQVDPPEWEIVASGATVYEYTDGSTHADPYETWRMIRKSVVRKSVDAQLNVVSERREGYRYTFRRKAIWSGGSADTLHDPPTYLNDAGEGVTDYRERIGVAPDDLTTVDFFLAADGSIEREQEKIYYLDIGQPRRNVTGAYGYGVDSITWASRSSEGSSAFVGGGLRVVERGYRVVSEDGYQITERQTFSDGTEARTIKSSGIGAPPRPERIDPEVFTQELRALVEDRERIFLSGQTIEHVEPNEYVESQAEAEAYARILARRASAITLRCAVPIETLAHKYRMARVNLPGSEIHGLKFYIRDVERDAATFRESIVAHYYDPELS